MIYGCTPFGHYNKRLQCLQAIVNPAVTISYPDIGNPAAINIMMVSPLFHSYNPIPPFTLPLTFAFPSLTHITFPPPSLLTLSFTTEMPEQKSQGKTNSRPVTFSPFHSQPSYIAKYFTPHNKCRHHTSIEFFLVLA